MQQVDVFANSLPARWQPSLTLLTLRDCDRRRAFECGTAYHRSEREVAPLVFTDQFTTPIVKAQPATVAECVALPGLLCATEKP